MAKKKAAKKKPLMTLRWPANGKRKGRGPQVCRLSDCDGGCGRTHPKWAAARPDPTGLEAANVRTTGRLSGRPTPKGTQFIGGGGLPGLGKR
jgi:hypothetical protein